MDQISPLFALINVLPRVLKKLLDLFLNLVLLPRIEFSFETKRDLVKKKMSAGLFSVSRPFPTWAIMTLHNFQLFVAISMFFILQSLLIPVHLHKLVK